MMRNLVVTRELVGGLMAMTVAALGSGALYPGTSPAGRVFVVSVACGVLAAVLTDWRARVAVTAAAVVIFIVHLAPERDVPTGDVTSWSYSPLIMAAAIVGTGYHWMTHLGSLGDRDNRRFLPTENPSDS